MQVYRKIKHIKIISNKRAFSSIIGAVFAILVIGSLTGTFFVWSLSQNSRYVNTVAEINQLAQEQKKESLNVTVVGTPQYPVLGLNTVGLNCTIQNDGPISINLTSLWIQDLNLTTNKFGSLNLNWTLSPGESRVLDSNLFVTIQGATSGHIFSGWVITARGNEIQLYPAHQSGPRGFQGSTGPIGSPGADFNATGQVHLYNGSTSYRASTALVAQGIGVISMDFNRFTHFEFLSDQSGLNISSIPPSSSNYTIGSNAAYLLFHAVLSNMDPDNNITLESSSAVYILGGNSGGGSVKFASWSLAAVRNGVLISNPGTSVVLPRNNTEWTDIYFYGSVPTGSNKISAGLYPMNIMLYGTKGHNDYGQNVPFVSLNFMA